MKVKSINSRYDVGNLGQVEAKSFLTHSVALACSLLKFDGTLGNIDALISSKLQHPLRGKPPDIGDWFVSIPFPPPPPPKHKILFKCSISTHLQRSGSVLSLAKVPWKDFKQLFRLVLNDSGQWAAKTSNECEVGNPNAPSWHMEVSVNCTRTLSKWRA